MQKLPIHVTDKQRYYDNLSITILDYAQIQPARIQNKSISNSPVLTYFLRNGHM